MSSWLMPISFLPWVHLPCIELSPIQEKSQRRVSQSHEVSLYENAINDAGEPLLGTAALTQHACSGPPTRGHLSGVWPRMAASDVEWLLM